MRESPKSSHPTSRAYSSPNNIDPRLPSLRLVGLLGILTAWLIYISGESLRAFSALDTIADNFPLILGNYSANYSDDFRHPVQESKFSLNRTPYRSSFQANCPRSSRIVRLIFPHVNKAGGRTIEGTFDSSVSSNVFLISSPRSRRIQTFELYNGHHSYPELASITSCPLPSRKCAVNTKRSPDICARWIFMMRDPLTRTLSAFYTSVGRKVATENPLANHFECAKGSKPAKLLTDPKSTFEDFASLPLDVRRKSCYSSVANLHLKYLEPKRMDLEVAKSRLQLMDWVGLNEEFELSMQLLSFDLDLDLDLFTPVFNLNSYRKENLSERAMEALIDMNRHDLELYQFAKTKLFEPRVENMRRAFKGIWPWEKPAKCDERMICFDKRSRDVSSAWELKSPPSWIAQMDSGERKENILCAPKSGCQLARGKPVSKCLASFFIIGARKGGTTSLYQYITSHPRAKGILLDKGAQTGETFFFERESTTIEKSKLPAVTRMQYNHIYVSEFLRFKYQFDSRVDMTGESSVGMGPSCFTPRTLKETCGPDVKMIYLLRDPVERMYSQFAMRQRLTPERLPVNSDFAMWARLELDNIWTKMDRLSNWLENPKLPPPCIYSTDEKNSVWSGLYAIHLKRWMGHYDPSRIMVIQSEVFFKEPARITEKVYEFLGLHADLVNISEITQTAYNAAPANQDNVIADEQIDKELRDFFAPFNRVVKNMFPDELDLKLWKMRDDDDDDDEVDAAVNNDEII